MLRIESSLGDETEQLVQRTIGCCIAVHHRELGAGLLERVSVRAVRIELEAMGIGCETEKSLPVFYRGQLLAQHRVDVVLESRLLRELKAIERLAPVHRAQVMSYPHVSNLRVALLANFNSVCWWMVCSGLFSSGY